MMPDIIFLAHRLPWPPDRGDKMRSYHILRALAAHARIHLFAFAEDPAEMQDAEALRPHVASMYVEMRSSARGLAVLRALLTGQPASVAMFSSPSMMERVSRTLTETHIDTIFAFSGQMAQFVPPQAQARFIADLVDVDSQKFATYSQSGPLLLRWLYGREGRLLLNFELAVARQAECVTFVSGAEAELFKKLGGLNTARVIAIENGIDLDRNRPDGDFVPLAGDRLSGGPLLVFTGQMDYRPNVDAVSHFAEHSLPVVQKFWPDVQFAIVGRNPSPQVERLAERPGIVVTGTVADVRPWIAAASVVVAPLRIARGVQNKVLEAMAMGKAVVASSAAAEGIDAEAGRELMVADGEQVPIAILDLLGDAGRAAAMAAAARRRMEARYRWDDRLAPLVKLVAGC